MMRAVESRRSGETRDVASIERRDPSAAHADIQGVGLANIGTWGESWSEQAYIQNVYLYAAVRAIAEDLAACPVRVGRDPSNPDDYDVAHPLAQLLGPAPGGPNNDTTAAQLMAWTVVQWVIHGRFGWELDRPAGGGNPVGLWPIAARRITPVRAKGGTRWFSSFGVNMGSGAGPRTFTPERLFYAWRPSLKDWFEAESVLAAARADVTVAILMDRYDVAFLRNDARPAAVIVHDAIEDDTERRAFRDQLRGEHQGVDNAGKVAFAEQDPFRTGSGPSLQVEQLGLTHVEAQMAERYKSKILGILAALGVPMSRLGDSSERTFSNAGHEWTAYWTTTIGGLARQILDHINLRLAPLYGTEVAWFDFGAVEALRPENRYAGQDQAALFKAGLTMVDESRIRLGLPPLPGGRGQVFIDEWEPARVGMKSADSVLSGRAGIDLVVQTGGPSSPVAGPEAAPQSGRESRQSLWQTIAATAAALESDFEARYGRLLTRQRRAVVDRIAGKRGRQALRFETRAANPDEVAARVFDVDFWVAETAEELQLLYQSITVMSGQQMSARFGASFDVLAPGVTEFVDARSNQLAGQVTDTTYQAIKDEIAAGIRAGESIPDLAGRIERLFDTTWATRATTVARTETLSAFNGAAVTAALQFGPDVVAAQEWLAGPATPSARAWHRAMDGVAIRVGDLWELDGERMAYPGDPSASAHNNVNCRCSVAFLTPDEAADRGFTI